MTTRENTNGSVGELEKLTRLRSNFGPKETMDRLERELRSRGMSVFARINHAVLAAEVGLSLPPTELLIFGNPRAGTPLMQANQMVGIDLPLKALVWRDAAATTWLAYHDPEWLVKRHGLGVESEVVSAQMASTLEAIAKNATVPPQFVPLPFGLYI